MDHREKAKRLKAFLQQIAPGNAIESLIPPMIETGRLGMESAGPGPVHSETQRALEKVADGRPETLSSTEMFHLEAIVLGQNRPVTFIRDKTKTYDDLVAPWAGLNSLDVRTRLNPLLPLIGRIEVPNSPILPYAGTGFVVGPGLIATNRHVAQLFSQGLGLTITYRTGDAAINFNKQVDADPSDTSMQLTVVGVEMMHPYWDIAILRVSGLPASAALRLSTRPCEDLVGRNIVVVGYPARDDRNDLALQDRIFGSEYFVKRLQPGMVRERALIQSFESRVNALTHDASTLGGNSGSAVIDVESGEVVALHFAGEYLKANYAVPTYELARDRLVASKLNFDGAVTATEDWSYAWRATQPQETAMPAADPTFDLALPSSRDVEHSVSHGEVTWTIPLRVTVSIGAVEMSPDPRVVPDASATVASEGVVVDQDYTDRPGYDPNFLSDVSVPLPALAAAMEKDTAQVDGGASAGNPYELKYYHYSVMMNKRRRTAWYSAANVDGKQRPNIGKRQGDRWYVDTRIAKTDQLGQDAFESGIDRGHLTRREDTAWGKDVNSATRANNDTFHFTNCSLQASAFNRGKDRWQGLEQFLLEQHAKKDKLRMIVITGPIFAPNDPTYGNAKMNYTVQCPLQFWKVCVLIRETDGKPSATGFILGQDEIKDLPGFEETFDVAATQIKIAELEQRTGLDFGETKQWDHFAAGGSPGTLELPCANGARLIKCIRTGNDIVV